MRKFDFIICYDDEENYTKTIDLNDTSEFVVESVSNISWAESEIAASVNPFVAGDTLQNVHPMPRDIEFIIKPNSSKGNYDSLVNLFSKGVGRKIVLVRDIDFSSFTVRTRIEGVMQNFDTPRFENNTRIAFTVHCSNPYWKSANLPMTFESGDESTSPYSKQRLYLLLGTVPVGFTMEAVIPVTLRPGDIILIMQRKKEGNSFVYYETMQLNALRTMGPGVLKLSTIRNNRFIKYNDNLSAMIKFKLYHLVNEKIVDDPFMLLQPFGATYISVVLKRAETGNYTPLEATISNEGLYI